MLGSSDPRLSLCFVCERSVVACLVFSILIGGLALAAPSWRSLFVSREVPFPALPHDACVLFLVEAILTHVGQLVHLDG